MVLKMSRLNFNSRPHGGRRIVLFVGVLVADISTHALTEGDIVLFVGVLVADISTHALTEGDYRSGVLFIV